MSPPRNEQSFRDEAYSIFIQNWERLLDREAVPSAVSFLSAFEISDKSGSLVPFRLNPIQMSIQATVDRLDADGEMVRVAVLKARQHGVSQYGCARLFEKAMRNGGVNCVLMADIESNTSELYGSKISELWKQIPKRCRPQANPTVTQMVLFHGQKEHGRGIKSKVKGRSTIISITGGRRLGGASRTIHHLHVSEAANIENAEEVLLNTFPAVPKLPGTSIILESTGNGASGMFWKIWTDAKQAEKDGTRQKGGWIAMFFPWFDNGDYTLPFDSEEEKAKFIASLTTEEETQKTLYGVSWEQLHWWRWILTQDCGGDKMRRSIHYPSCPEDAFVATGTCRFDRNDLSWIKANKNPKPVGNGGLVKNAEGGIEWFSDSQGKVTLYRKPVAGVEYIIGADCATGKGDTGNQDYSAALVYTRKSRRLCARIHARIDTLEYTPLLDKLGRWYNNALLCPENTGIGLSVIDGLLKLRYPRLYIEGRLGTVTAGKNDKWGFSMDSKERRDYSVDSAAIEVSMRRSEMATETIDEAMNFVLKANNRWEAAGSGHDDEVMAFAILCAVNRREGYQTAEEKPEEPEKVLKHNAAEQKMIERYLERVGREDDDEWNEEEF